MTREARSETGWRYNNEYGRPVEISLARKVLHSISYPIVIGVIFGLGLLISSYAPEWYDCYLNVVIGFGLYAFIIIISSVVKNRVDSIWWLTTWLRSWGAFILAVVLLAAVWWLCYLAIEAWAPSKLGFFRWAAYFVIPAMCLALMFNEALVVWTTGAKRIRCREDCPVLWDAVRTVTPWHARPVPRIYLLPDHGSNAISFGWGLPFFSAVGATRGLLDALGPKEVEGVMAHEIGHIINKDILVSMALACSVMVIATTGWALWRLGTGVGDDKDSGKAAIVALIVGGLMFGIGRLLGFILQAFVSRQREYAADATSARLLGSGKPLRSALCKIVRDAQIGSRGTGACFGFLCTADPEPDDVMATHPSLENRLWALDLLEL